MLIDTNNSKYPITPRPMEKETVFVGDICFFFQTQYRTNPQIIAEMYMTDTPCFISAAIPGPTTVKTHARKMKINILKNMRFGSTRLSFFWAKRGVLSVGRRK